MMNTHSSMRPRITFEQFVPAWSLKISEIVIIVKVELILQSVSLLYVKIFPGPKSYISRWLRIHVRQPKIRWPYPWSRVKNLCRQIDQARSARSPLMFGHEMDEQKKNNHTSSTIKSGDDIASLESFLDNTASKAESMMCMQTFRG